MADIRAWSLIASQNGTLGSPPDYWPEGQAPSTVNDCAREMMRAIKKQFLDAGWVDAGDTPTYISATKFSVSSSTSTAVNYYAVGKRIRLNDATTLYATVTEASISATTTNITATLDSGSLSASLTAVAFSIVGTTSNPALPQSVLYQDLAKIYAADAQASDTYVITLSPVPGSYTNGMMVHFKANTANTGACTINVNGLGAKSIKKNYNVDPATNDILANQIVSLIYDGTNFQMLSPSGGVGTIISSTVLTGAAVAVTTGTAADVTSISLTAGDWDVRGNICTVLAAGTVTSRVAGWVSTTSATPPTAPNAGAYTYLMVDPVANEPSYFFVGIQRISVSSPTTVYLTAQINFTVSTAAAFGYLEARRIA
jgi:hypothetical protein